MKSCHRPSGFLLIGFMCAFGALVQSVFPASSSKASSPSQSSVPAVSTPAEEATIPGPLRSFLRMAAISQKVSPEEILPLLARNVDVYGYRGGKPTQFLILLNWYMDQVRELQALAGPQLVIHVSNCEEAKPLLVILGYRLQQPCGQYAALETANADRAFITIDSGFPLADLEETIRGGKPFEIPYSSTKVPVLFREKDWVLNEKNADRGVVDSLLRDPNLSRLYWGLSRIDNETAHFLWGTLGRKKLLAVAPALDFYGDQISVRAGRVLVPGGTASETAWKDVVGASPSSPADFVDRLLTKDDGWLAVYFDELSRTGKTEQGYFADPTRLRRFYEALRAENGSVRPTRHAFRPDEGLFMLVTRFQLDPNGQPHIPGNMEIWKGILRRNSNDKILKEWAKRAGGLSNPEQLMEAMVGVSKVNSREGPVHIFLALNEIDRWRSPDERLSIQTIQLLADRFQRFGDQYPIFAEFHTLNDASIVHYLTVAENISQVPDHLVRADALGIFQANIGLWQILARQGEIPDANLNDSWLKIVDAFGSVRSSAQVFDAGKTAFGELLRAATGKPALSQDQFIALLAGPDQASRENQQLRSEMANRIRQALNDQRLVPLDTILALGDGLRDLAKGKDSDSLLPLAGELREFEMPRPLFTNRERTELTTVPYGARHITLQMQTDLAKVIKSPGTPAEVEGARGLLTPFLRDTLVGLNYAYYEPPGAQMLHNNPLFVRTHDFSGGEYSGQSATAVDQIWRSPTLFGRGWTASGGAHLVGSLADLPYVLAKMEQDFIVPQNVQSLIWADLVPGLLTSAVLPRWWGVTHNELHAVTLYQRTGEELVTAAAKDEKLRQMVVDILSDRMLPQGLEHMEIDLHSGRQDDALIQLTPAEAFYLAAEFRRRYPQEKGKWGPAGKELDDLAAHFPAETSVDRLSADFGVPHPALAENYGRGLMNLKPPPAFLDYSSRFLAESWDSSNLYWARLADEMGYSPEMLNLLIPQLTHRMVEQTFASNLEDWPAILRAMRETGEEFRQGKIAALTNSNPSSGL